jgi:tripartite-type tricarboxylate transporter receptor subunit TctC
MTASSAYKAGRDVQMPRKLPRLLLSTVVVFAAAHPAFAEDWPTRPITVVVPFDAGGSVDRLARGIAKYLPKELGQPITVVDQPGAGGQIGTTWLLHQPDDGYSLMVTPAVPYLAVNILITKARYRLSDFAFVNAQWTDFQFLAVAKDRPYKTVGELVDAIKANPGKMTVGVTFGSQGHFATLALLDALKLPPSAVRLVTFDGGGTLRSALLGGQVDFSIVQAEGSDSIKSLIRPLAVYLDHRVDEFDAVPINEALKAYGISVPLLSGSIRTLVAPAGFKAKHPADFARLTEAYKRTLANPEFEAWVKTSSMGDDWLDPMFAL